jgi:DNA gyrase subunit A
MSLDPRLANPETLLAVTRRGFGLRFATASQTEVTTKAGRRYARPQEGDAVIGVVGCRDADVVVVATQQGHVLHCNAEEIAKLEGPGRGVTVIKTEDDDHVIGFVAGDKSTTLQLENAAGKAFPQIADRKQVTGRGGKGGQLQRKTTFKVVLPPVTIPSLGAADGGN